MHGLIYPFIRSMLLCYVLYDSVWGWYTAAWMHPYWAYDVDDCLYSNAILFVLGSDYIIDGK